MGLQREIWHLERVQGKRFVSPDGLTASVAAVAAPDGLLPETYDPTTGRWLARPWFAWPAATLAALALGAWTSGSSPTPT